MKRLIALALILVAALPVVAQKGANEELGFKAEKLYDFQNVDSVSLFNGNLVLALPLMAHKVSSTLSSHMALVYNSKVLDYESWDCENPSTGEIERCGQFLPNLRSSAGLGWRISMGRLLPPTEPSLDHNSLDRYSYVYESPAGDEHKFGEVNDEAATVQMTTGASALRLIKLGPTIRDVEFPSGEVHRFQFIYSVWRLIQISDRFNNAVYIGYVLSADKKRELQWRITDTAGRQHDVYFDNYPSMADGWTRGQQVRQISFQAFGGQTATYDFEYTPAWQAAPCSFNNSTVPLLTKLTRPDESEYQFTYHSNATSPCDWGPLQSIRFPTAGTVSYGYQNYHLAEDDACATGFWGASSPLSTPGIKTRTIEDGTSTRVWTYVQRRGPAIPIEYPYPDPCGTGTPPVGPFYWSRTTVLSPVDGNNKRTRTDSYFNLFDGNSPDDFWPGNGTMPYGYPLTAGMPPADRAKGSVETVPELDATYPRDISAGDGTRYLGTQVYAGCASDGNCTDGELLRATYNHYEPTIFDWHLDSSRTVFHDDTGCSGTCYVQVSTTGPDGAGNYRTSTTESNFPGASTITTYTALPAWTTTDLANSSKKWITNVYTEKTRTENGVTAREQFDFESSTGFLLRHRVLAGDTPGANDILNVFSRDTGGNIQFTYAYGGDKQTLDTGSDLPSIPLPSAFWYKTEHEYVNGVLASSQYYDRTTTLPIGFKHVDRTIDSSTGVVTEARDTAGVTTSYTYSAKPARLETVTIPSGAVTTYTYTNATGSPASGLTRAKVESSTPSASGTLKSQFDFDGLGRVIRKSHLGPQNTWNATETAFDEMGRVAWTSQPESTGANPPSGSLTAAWKTQHLYDAFSRPIRTTLPDGSVTSMSYEGVRTATRTFTIAAGGATESTVGKREQYDPSGRLVAVTENADPDPDDGVPTAELTTSYSYDIGGRLASVSMPGQAGTQTRTFTYDLRGFLQEEEHPEVGADGYETTTYSQYDARGHAGQKTIGTTIDLRFDFDSAERLIKVSDAMEGGRELELFSWDCIRFDVTQPCTTIDRPGRLGASARFNYDPELGTIAVSEGNGYHPTTGQLVRRDRAVGNGEVAGVTRFEGQSFFFGESHNDLGLVETLTYPCRTGSNGCVSGDSGRSIVHGYTNGQLTSVGTHASSITYRPNGVVDTIKHGSGTTAVLEKWAADPHGMARPSRIYTTNAAGTQELWSTGSYEFDGAGNVKTTGNTSYRYDPLGRLNSWTTTGALGSYATTTRGYDEFGNHTFSTFQGCGPTPNPRCYTTTLVPRDLVETTNHYADTTYDAAGNVTLDVDGRAYEWDPLGMMTGATVDGRKFRYLYDAHNERIAAVERVPYQAQFRNRTTFTLRGSGNQLLSTWTDDWTSGSRVFTRKEDSIWRGPQLVASITPSSTMSYSLDHLGSPRLITNATGGVTGQQEFDPFGSGGLFGSGALQFTGHERDQANLGGGLFNLPDYFHARFYDKAGRFLSVDPILGRASQPQSWNRYAYVANNPLNYMDPTGLNPCFGRRSPRGLDEGIGIWCGDDSSDEDDESKGKDADDSGVGLFGSSDIVNVKKIDTVMKTALDHFNDIGINLMLITAPLGEVAAGGGFILRSGMAGEVLPMTIVRLLPRGTATINELKALTFETGLEHAVVRLASGERALVSGGSGGISFGPGQIRRIVVHTHPYEAVAAGASAADRAALTILGQAYSYVLERGRLIKFGGW